jgi:hypothetical protein
LVLADNKELSLAKRAKADADKKIVALNKKLATLTKRKVETTRSLGGSVTAIVSGGGTAAVKALIMRSKWLPAWFKKIPVDGIAGAFGLGVAFMGEELGLSDDAIEFVASVAEGPAVVCVADTLREAINPTAPIVAVAGADPALGDVDLSAAFDEVELGR